MQGDNGGAELDGEVEVDETYIGGKARNMNRRKRARASGTTRRRRLGGQGRRDGAAGAQP